jgi:hypothetical protein
MKLLLSILKLCDGYNQQYLGLRQFLCMLRDSLVMDTVDTRNEKWPLHSRQCVRLCYSHTINFANIIF